MTRNANIADLVKAGKIPRSAQNCRAVTSIFLVAIKHAVYARNPEMVQAARELRPLRTITESHSVGVRLSDSGRMDSDFERTVVTRMA